MADSLDSATAALALFAATYVGVELLGLMLNQDYDGAGQLVQVVDVLFRLQGRPGSLSVQVPYEAYWVAMVEGAMMQKAELVRRIYRGEADAGYVLSEPPVTAIPPIGGAVPV